MFIAYRDGERAAGAGGAAVAAGAERELVRVRLRVRQQLAEVLRRQPRIRGQHDGHVGQTEPAGHLVGDLLHQLMGSDLGPVWQDHEQRNSKMVFIGIDLPKDILLQGLEQCLAPAS